MLDLCNKILLSKIEHNVDNCWKHYAKKNKLGMENCMFYNFMDLKTSKESNSQSLTVHYDLPCILKYREIRKIQLEQHGFTGVNKNALKLMWEAYAYNPTYAGGWGGRFIS